MQKRLRQLLGTIEVAQPAAAKALHVPPSS
jgi:hypothetical protein